MSTPLSLPHRNGTSATPVQPSLSSPAQDKAQQDASPKGKDSPSILTSWDILMPNHPPLTVLPRFTQVSLPPDVKVIEELSCTCVTGDWSAYANLAPYVARNVWRADLDNFPSCTSFSTFVAFRETVLREYPDYHVRFLNVTTHVENSGCRADVIMMFEISGRPKGTRRQSLSVLRWKRVMGGQWKWYRLESMRGVGRMFGIGGEVFT